MTINIGMLLVVIVLSATGVYLLLERSLIRMLLGLILIGNGINLLILTTSNSFGKPAIKSKAPWSEGADPLAQAMILTAIVITMGLAAFILALAYRSFMLNTDDGIADDSIPDDEEDKKVSTLTEADAPDRDKSDDSAGADTERGDLFDEFGNPLTKEELERRRAAHLEPDLLLPETDVMDVLFEPDEIINNSDSATAPTQLSSDNS